LIDDDWKVFLLNKTNIQCLINRLNYNMLRLQINSRLLWLILCQFHYHLWRVCCKLNMLNAYATFFSKYVANSITFWNISSYDFNNTIKISNNYHRTIVVCVTIFSILNIKFLWNLLLGEWKRFNKIGLKHLISLIFKLFLEGKDLEFWFWLWWSLGWLLLHIETNFKSCWKIE
jgi:hypothetical protein